MSNIDLSVNETGVAKLKELLPRINIFQAIFDIKEFPFIDNVNLLQMRLLMEYGERTVYIPVLLLEDYDLALYLISKYGDKWVSLYSVAIDNLASGSSQIETEAIAENTIKEENSDLVNKVSAFNTDALINDTGTDNNNNLTQDKDSTRTKTTSIVNYKYLYANLSLSEKTNIINVVMKDISNCLTLDIY